MTPNFFGEPFTILFKVYIFHGLPWSIVVRFDKIEMLYLFPHLGLKLLTYRISETGSIELQPLGKSQKHMVLPISSQTYCGVICVGAWTWLSSFVIEKTTVGFQWFRICYDLYM